MRRRLAGVLDYTGPVSTGLVLWAWTLHLPYAEQLLTARLCPDN